MRSSNARPGAARPVTSIAAMSLRQARLGSACAVALAALAIAGCGGDDAPEPSISAGDAQELIDTLDEVEANVDVGSCLVAEDKVGELAGPDRLPARRA